MENRSLLLVASLIFLALPGFAVHAEEELGSPEQRADWAQRLERAQALTDESKQRREAAAKIRKDKDAECPKRFQVNACLKESQNEYMLVERQARRLENDGQAMERAVRKEQLQEKDARNKVESARRAAELPVREAETATARQDAAAREAQIHADKAVKAEAGEKRKAAQAEKLRQKQAAHAARVAEKMKKAQERSSPSAPPGK